MGKKRKKRKAEREESSIEREGKNVIRLKKSGSRGAVYYGPADFQLILFVIALVFFGVVMVFSASFYTAMSKEGSPYYYLIKDSIWATVGIIAMTVLSNIDYHRLKRVSPYILTVAFVLLLLLIFTDWGITLNNARRWLDLKIFTIMPGEVMKPAMIIFVAAFLSNEPERARRLRSIFFLLLVTGAACVLIYKQPNLSTAVTLGIITMGMLFIAGIKISQFIGLSVAFSSLLYLRIISRGGFHLDRIKNFRHPELDQLDLGYQVYQSLLALGSGGVLGVGIGNSIQKTLYLPEPQNDFILAIIGEELGYVGLLILLAVYLLVIWRCVYIAIKAPDMFGRLLASGIAIMFSVHIIFNTLIVTAWMPPTGIILPFVSWGGNALVIFMACIGIILNISRQSKK